MIWIITFLHTCFFLALLVGPLFNSNYLLTLHALFIPFILAHWFSGDNTCAVTLTERAIRKMRKGDKYNDDDCVSCKIIEPVFDFPKYYPKYYKSIIVIGIVLWLCTMYKLYNKYKIGDIRSWKDLFTL